MEPLGFDLELDLPFDAAVDRVIAALKDEGFGVLTRIDVHDAFKEKLDVDFRPYVILGACNPPLALKVLEARPEAGLLLPCNVTVEAKGAGVLVRIVSPRGMMAAAGFDRDENLREVGAEAHERLARVADRLRSP